MSGGFEAFIALSREDQRDVFDAAARRLDTLSSHVEKDFWVCLVLDALYDRLPDGHPRLIFKGGTSLSKGFQLIERFSEDIDLVVPRRGLGFDGARDPAAPALSNKRRKTLLGELGAACSNYALGDLAAALAELAGGFGSGCGVRPDRDDASRQTLLVEYRSLYPGRETTYVTPRVKIEAGARSALDPSATCTVIPYVADELRSLSFSVDGVRVLAPERTYWEKALILHGVYCGYRDQARQPADRHRVARHYYDVAMITATDCGRAALSRLDLLDAVRDHNLLMFRQAWKRFEEAVAGLVRLVPQPKLHPLIDRDYRAMEGMILGEAPDFTWIIEQLQRAEDAVNAV